METVLTTAADMLHGPERRVDPTLPRTPSASPRLDAELLFAHAYGITREETLLAADLYPYHLGAFFRLFSRRMQYEPMAYILGEKHFRSLKLMVDNRVLIPRPDTELLVDITLEHLAAGASVIDVGTGSGAIALALKSERPDLVVSASEHHIGDITVAQINAERLGLDLIWYQSDLLEDLPQFEVVVANLPYLAAFDWLSCPRTVREFEPTGALLGGSDGLTLIGSLISQLGTTPLVVLEIGRTQARAVSEMLHLAGYEPAVHRDLAGHDRVVVGQYNNST
jgi:release factor glutamine methyltransferase